MAMSLFEAPPAFTVRWIWPALAISAGCRTSRAETARMGRDLADRADFESVAVFWPPAAVLAGQAGLYAFDIGQKDGALRHFESALRADMYTQEMGLYTTPSTHP